ncbi:TonB C-terminal domain-containing protein [Paraburkholderia unamae]|uniref:TonB C-terminal domain-containing protein n=1 Tax=Paraburkholderia unamae TaxID=219649 RepID=UPI000DD4366F|nr:TonB C-terminal domain-containing protein [Paraburkholderia unamae]CAG9267747.1 hypothetical protein PUN4_550029 [Paraburkholderia unamae]
MFETRQSGIGSGNTSGLEAELSVRCSPRRTLLPAKIGRSSGNPSWDTAALRAAQRPDPDARGRRLKKRLQALR